MMGEGEEEQEEERRERTFSGTIWDTPEEREGSTMVTGSSYKVTHKENGV